MYQTVHMLKHLIKYDKIPAVIDDISSTVIMKEKNPIDDCVERSNEIVKGNIKNNNLKTFKAPFTKGFIISFSTDFVIKNYCILVFKIKNPAS